MHILLMTSVDPALLYTNHAITRSTQSEMASTSLEPGMQSLQIAAKSDDNKSELFTVPYRKSAIYYDNYDEFKTAWENQVKPAFADHGLSCTLDEEKMSFALDPSKQAPHPIIYFKACNTLFIISTGRWKVEVALKILSGQLECEVWPIKRLDGITEKEFHRRLRDFHAKFHKLKITLRLECNILCHSSEPDEQFVTVLAKSVVAKSLVSSLVDESLYRGISLEEKSANEVTQTYLKYKDKPEDYVFIPPLQSFD